MCLFQYSYHYERLVSDALTDPSILAFCQYGTTVDVHVEEMYLLIPMHNIPMAIDPDQRIFDFIAVQCGLVNPNVDRQVGLFCLVL